MVRVVAHEIRDFLAATDLSKELQKALTTLSFEINTQIRFVPNDKGGVRPEVRAQVDPKRRRARRRRRVGSRYRVARRTRARTSSMMRWTAGRRNRFDGVSARSTNGVAPRTPADAPKAPIAERAAHR